MMKKNTKAMCVRTNIRAGKGGEGKAVGYSKKECMEKCTVNEPKKLCKRFCHSKD